MTSQLMKDHLREYHGVKHHSVPYRHQPALFATLTPLMERGELGPSALLGAPALLLEKYAHVLWQTVGYVVSKLNRKAAPSEVRVFCSHALSIAFFRLPLLRPVPLGRTPARRAAGLATEE